MLVPEVLRASHGPDAALCFLVGVFASSANAPVRLFMMILQDIAECRDGWKHALLLGTPVHVLLLGRKEQLVSDEFELILKVGSSQQGFPWRQCSMLQLSCVCDC